MIYVGSRKSANESIVTESRSVVTWEWARHSGVGGREGLQTGKGVLGDAGYLHYFDCGDGFHGCTHISKVIKLYALNIYCVPIIPQLNC